VHGIGVVIFESGAARRTPAHLRLRVLVRELSVSSEVNYSPGSLRIVGFLIMWDPAA
jgi:hypothetical protein